MLQQDTNCVVGSKANGRGFSHQIDGSLERTGGVQDLVHDGGLELVGVQLLWL